jgi:hypothetical protein
MGKFELNANSRFMRPNTVGLTCKEGQGDFAARF